MSDVLIVDDEPSFRSLLRIALERAGHDVREAEDGCKGLALYSQKHADLVITDLSMPQMTGLEMMVAMQRAFGAVKTFVVSGRGEAQLQQAKSLGALAVWPKPFDFDEFMGAVHQEVGI
ncbi:MAG TPA: response regulator [Nitrospira sp.]|nr:response regulator [Nitrospira sp.]